MAGAHIVGELSLLDFAAWLATSTSSCLRVALDQEGDDEASASNLQETWYGKVLNVGGAATSGPRAPAIAQPA